MRGFSFGNGEPFSSSSVASFNSRLEPIGICRGRGASTKCDRGRRKLLSEQAGEYDDEADDGAPLRSDGEGGGGIEANAKNTEKGVALVRLGF